MQHGRSRPNRFKPVRSFSNFQPLRVSEGWTHQIKERTLNLQTNTKILIFLAFLSIFRLTVLIRRRSADAFDAIDAYAMLDIAFIGLTVLFLSLHKNLNRAINDLSPRSAGIFLLYYLLCASSALWSPLPEYSLFRSIQIISQLLVIMITLYEHPTFLSAEKFVIRTSMVLILIDIFASIYRHGFVISIAGMHTNTYSNSAAMLCCYCINEYFASDGNRQKMLRNYGIVSIMLTFLGTSATSNIALLSGLFFAGLISQNRKYRLTLTYIASALIIFSLASHLAFQFGVKQVLLAGKKPEQVGTLTGRTKMWAHYYEQAQTKPIAGHGFAIANRIGGFYATSTHNMLLSVFLDLGILGLLIICWVMRRVITEIKQAGQEGEMGRAGLIGVFVIALVACQSTPFIAVVWSAPSAVFGLFLAFHTYYGAGASMAFQRLPHHAAHRSPGAWMRRVPRRPRDPLTHRRHP